MIGTVYVMKQADYQAWLDSGASVTADESYLRESILMAQAKTVRGYEHIMPTFQGLINEDGVASLIEYIKSLQAGGNRVASAQ
jgi:cytochrome c oxidase subunit 2